LVIVGDGHLRQALQEQADEQLKDRIFWLGFLDLQQAKLAYHACHALVLPSDYEPWAVVVTEALAAGLPVIASHVCGAAHELRKFGKAVYCFQTGDLEDLADKIKMLADHQNLSDFRAEAARTLKSWHNQSDPIEGIRCALLDCGILN
jgi:glycosyltransferase involved in cell wall biosynthesis